MESGINLVKDIGEHDLVRNEVCNILQNHKIHKAHHTPKDFKGKMIHGFLKETKLFLRNNPKILTLRADKGNVTVVMLKDEYISKVNQLFSDEVAYEVMHDGDPTEKIQNRMNRMISEWQRNGFFNEDSTTNVRTAKWLRSYAGVIPKAYGLTKIHKEGNPMRPVVAFINSPLYNISKFFADILKNMVGNEVSSVKNSYDLIENIKDIRIPSDHKLVSFDVVSLFTNIPSKLVIGTIKRKWDVICQFTRFPKDQFIRGLNFILENCFFSFNNIIYHQIFGTPMGSPVSPVIADLVMEVLEQNVLRTLMFKPAFYFRYVDDILFTVPVCHLNETLTRFNNFNQHIKFTVEVEKENQLAFLDVLLIRKHDGSLVTDWYHKQTWSGRYINFDSCLPFTYKRNTVLILAEKIFKLSHSSLHAKNVDILVSTLVNNGYPKNIVLDLVESKRRQVLERGSGFSGTENSSGNNNNYWFSIPYTKGVFEKIKHVFNKREVNVAAKPSNTLNELFSKTKDKVPTQLRSGVVYKIECSCSASYIGQTKQYLKTRCKQHKDQAMKGNGEHSALSFHASENPSHIVDWDGVSVVEVENNTFKRQIKECINIKREFINTNSNCINAQVECVNFKDVYVGYI